MNTAVECTAFTVWVDVARHKSYHHCPNHIAIMCILIYVRQLTPKSIYEINSKTSKMNWIHGLVDMRSRLSWFIGLLVPPQNTDHTCRVVIFWSKSVLASNNNAPWSSRVWDNNQDGFYIIVQMQESESSSSESLTSLQTQKETKWEIILVLSQ